MNIKVFTDIDGNIKTLQTALMDFANTSSDYFGVMGDSLKKELLNNLNVALETMKELQKMSDNYTAPNIDYSNTVLPKIVVLILLHKFLVMLKLIILQLEILILQFKVVQMMLL